MNIIPTPHICQGIKGDGTTCGKGVKTPTYGQWLCGTHVKPLLAYHEELARYRKHQEVSFGTVIMSRPVDDLQERLASLKRADRSDASDLHLVRLDAEATAITRELERRRVGAR